MTCRRQKYTTESRIGQDYKPNQTIDGVLRELIERAIAAAMTARGPGSPTERDLRALLDAPAKAEFSIPDCPDCACVQDGQCLCIPSKPAAQPQGEPVAWLDQVSGAIVTHKLKPMLCESGFEIPLYAEQPAPVAVARPRADEDEYQKGLLHGGIELWDKLYGGV